MVVSFLFGGEGNWNVQREHMVEKVSLYISQLNRLSFILQNG
jgi:hypothetical protein